MVNKTEPHDLVGFMQSVTSEIQSEYARIRSRTIEDPGTAGDEGEENWADLLRDWLPQNYHIVTKGRILARNNAAGPQLDILVLKPDYPRKLLNKKHYLAAGVIAAFECKTTLRKNGLKKSMLNAAKISKLLNEENQANYFLDKRKNINTAYMQLHRPIVYGLLAHSHDLGSTEEKARSKITELVKEFDSEIYKHPNELIDLICISDLALWQTQRAPYTALHYKIPDQYGNPITPSLENKPSTCYTCHYRDGWAKDSVHYKSTTTIGSLITALYKKLSYKDESLEEWARYFTDACAMGKGGGNWRMWGDILSSESKAHYDLSDPYNSNWGLDIFD